MSDERLAIAIPTFARPEYLVDALAALRQSRLNFKHAPRVWVIVNGPSDGYERLASTLSNDEWISWIWDPTEGLARARNRALREIHADHVAFLDDDARVAANWCSEAIRAIATYPKAAAIGGAVRAEFEGAAVPWWMPRDYGSSSVGAAEGEVRFVSGGNMIVSRALALDAGGFPEHLGMRGRRRAWGEETALLMEFARRGHTVVRFPSLEVSHVVKPHLHTLSGFLSESFAKGLQQSEIFPDSAYRRRDVPKVVLRSVMQIMTGTLRLALGAASAEEMYRGVRTLGRAVSAIRRGSL